ncbi:MAG TPA: hypothetical protein VF101_00275 [Gaiellaceae bacterium]
MSALAFVRPNGWDLPLFVHLIGAFALVGGVFATIVLAVGARRRTQHAALLSRLALRTLLAVVAPAFVVMRVGAQWILSKEKFAENSDWVGVGFAVSDIGALVVIALAALAWRASRRTHAGDLRPTSGAIVVGLASFYLAALAVAWWAMTTKPGS